MIAIIWKEIRENIKWALLGSAIFIMALALGWSKLDGPSRSYESYYSLLSPSILLATTLTPAVIAGALALLQILPEQKRDRWAFLVHRPVSLETIFWGKTAAGILLYFIAVLPPFAGIYWIASRPDVLPSPFDPRMALGGLSDILAGSVVYFAGMMAGVRNGRWLGSKLLGAAGAAMVIGLASRREIFLYSVIWVLVYGIIFLIAARGLFLHAGLWKPLGKFSKAAFVIIMLIGCSQVLFWTWGFVRGFLPRSNYYSENTLNYVILKDGTLAAAHYEAGQVKRVVTLDGKELSFTREQMATFYTETLNEISLRTDAWKDRPTPYRDISKYTLRLNFFGQSEWYYSSRARAYMSYTRMPKPGGYYLGKLTPAGFVPPNENSNSRFGTALPRNADRFMDTRESFTPIFDNKTYYIDTIRQETRLIYETSSWKGIYSSVMVPLKETFPTNSKSCIAISTPENILYFDTQGNVQAKLPWGHDRNIWSNVSTAVMPDGSYFFLRSMASEDAQKKNQWNYPIFIDKYGPDGALIQSWEMKATPSRGFHEPWYQKLSWSLYPPCWFAWNRLNWWVGAKLGIEEYASRWNYEKNHWKRSLEMWTYSAVASAISMLAGLWILLRKAQNRAGTNVAWMILLFLTGLAGLLAMLATCEWPVRVPCPACKEKRRVDEENCEKCGGAWPVPVRDGTEIFSPTKVA